MSGLFGGGGDGGASEQLKMQREQLAKGEARNLAKSTELAQRTMAGIKARRGGGQRVLLSGVYDGQDKTTLGG